MKKRNQKNLCPILTLSKRTCMLQLKTFLKLGGTICKNWMILLMIIPELPLGENYIESGVHMFIAL